MHLQKRGMANLLHKCQLSQAEQTISDNIVDIAFCLVYIQNPATIETNKRIHATLFVKHQQYLLGLTMTLEGPKQWAQGTCGVVAIVVVVVGT